MSSTRRQSKAGPLRQERFCSSASLRRGLLGNLVAKRLATVRTPRERSLLFFLADLSQRDGRPLHYTCNLFPGWPWPSTAAPGERAFERVARELVEMFPERIAPRQREHFRRVAPAFLTQLCLDPAMDLETVKAPRFVGIVEALCEYQVRFESAVRPRIAETVPAQTIFELLDYALMQRVMVLVEGTYRIGKSYAAQAWAQMHLGECRYVQLSSSADDMSFYRDIARALGLACGMQMKTAKIRHRIEETLREQQILLVLDEADYLWPQTIKMQTAPARANWLMTAFVNSGVPLALIASRNFSRMMAHIERRCPIWGSEQFHGRIKARRELPETLEKDDLAAIARLLLPGADEPTLLLLVGHAMCADGYVAALESAASRAKFFAAQAGRPVFFEDVERAMSEASNSANNLPPHQSAKVSRTSRELPAADRQPLGRPAALHNNFTGTRPTGMLR